MSDTIFINSYETNTVSLDGKILWEDRFSNADLNFDLNYQEQGLRVSTGFENELLMEAPDASLGIELFGEYISQRWRLNTLHVLNAGIPDPSNGLFANAWLDEKMETGRLGATVSIDTRTPVLEQINFVFGAGLDISAQYARLSGRECTPLKIGPCDGLHHSGVPADPVILSEANDDDITLGLSARVEGGLEFLSSENVNLSFLGFFETTWNAPYVRNPVYTDPAPASIEYDTAYSWGGRLRLTIPLNTAVGRTSQ